MTIVLALITGALLWRLLATPRCPVCQGKHYREPGEQHDDSCYLGWPR